MPHFNELFQMNKNPSPAQQQAWQCFSALGFPKQKQEQWRYTSLARLEKAEFALPQAKVSTALDLGALSGMETIWIRNGFTDVSGIKNKNLHVRSIQEVMVSDPSSDNALTHLNLALCSGGVAVQVKAGEKRASLLIVNQSEASVQTHVRNQIVIEANAEIDVVELFVGEEGQSYWSNSVTEIILQEGAKVSYAKLQLQSMLAYHTGSTSVRGAKDSEFHGFLLSKGSSLQREELHGHIEGEGAHMALYGLSVGSGKQHLDTRVNVEHQKGRSESRQIFKSIMSDESRGVFNGRIFIAKDAQHVDSKQMHKGLLLSAHAEIDAKPELEIYADDVKAAHGATVGQLSELETFYLMSRGISRAKAVELLTEGFVRDVIGKLKLKAVQDYVRAKC